MKNLEEIKKLVQLKKDEQINLERYRKEKSSPQLADDMMIDEIS